ncbi:YpjC [Streptococcus pneumoniae]|nr:YpjC [Streptococcus pneumoniae]
MIKKIYPIFTILLGAAIYAFGLTYFVVPHHLFEGGATGITLITFYLFKIPVSLMNLLINIPLFILAWKIFGAKSLYSSLLGTLALSAWLAFFEHIPLHIDLQGDLLITALIAGILLGIGLGIIFNAGGTTGGTDILARILNKYTHISIGKLYGSYLAKSLVNQLIEQNDKEFQIAVEDSNVGAKRLYEKIGFVKQTQVVYLNEKGARDSEV